MPGSRRWLWKRMVSRQASKSCREGPDRRVLGSREALSKVTASRSCCWGCMLLARARRMRRHSLTCNEEEVNQLIGCKC